MRQFRNCVTNACLFVVTTACVVPALAQSEPLKGAAAFGDWHADRSGVSRLIRPEDLPKPGATPSSAKFPQIVRRPLSLFPQVPAGFTIELFADGLSGPRQMRVAPHGDIFISETGPGRIRVLRAADGSSEYSGDGFAAEHGSWNRSKRSGYKVIRIRLKDGVPTGEYEDFVTGFVVSDSEVWGRPVGVAVAHDGALLISEDGNGTIWRVTH